MEPRRETSGAWDEQCPPLGPNGREGREVDRGKAGTAKVERGAGEASGVGTWRPPFQSTMEMLEGWHQPLQCPNRIVMKQPAGTVWMEVESPNMHGRVEDGRKSPTTTGRSRFTR